LQNENINSSNEVKNTEVSENRKKYSESSVSNDGHKRRHHHHHNTLRSNPLETYNTYRVVSKRSIRNEKEEKRGPVLRFFTTVFHLLFGKNKSRKGQKIEDFAMGSFAVIVLSVIGFLLLTTFGNGSSAVDFYSVIMLMLLAICFIIGLFYKNNYRRRFVGYGFLWTTSIVTVLFLAWLYWEININDPAKDQFQAQMALDLLKLL